MHLRRPWQLPDNPVANASYLHCGICGVIVHSTGPSDLRYPEVIAYEAEAACEAHLTERHPRRYELWKKLGWRWLVGGLAP